MNPLVSDYILRQSPNQQAILTRLRGIILKAADGIEEKFSFKIPFYYYCGWMCYATIERKTDHVYIAFIRGFELSNEQGILEAKGRTMVKSITYSSVKEIDEEALLNILHEAMLLNEMHFKKKKKKKGK